MGLSVAAACADEVVAQAPSFFVGKNKAQVLAALQGVLRSADVLPQYAFLVSDWRKGQDDILSAVQAQPFSTQPLIVRSSAAAEDSEQASMAGAFESVAGVVGRQSLKGAIERVIASYGAGHAGDMVFVQPMLMNARASGVAFTCDPNNQAPYYVIDYCEGSDTAATTSGSGQEGRTLYVHRERQDLAPELMRPVLSLCRELEEICGYGFLDIEFALTDKGAPVLFQVRPLVLKKTGSVDLWDRQRQALDDATRLVERLNRRIPYVAGGSTVLGNMPDWNPAEMIGLRPRPLALSLYKEMITDRIWAYQRDKYGYKNLRSVPLLYSLAGSPFIDVRASFHSFIPKMVSDRLAEKLVGYYIGRLDAQPELHDKIEFDIVFSCYTPDLHHKINRLKDHGFSDVEIAELSLALRDLTNRMTHPETGEWRVDRGKIDILKQRQRKIRQGDYTSYDKVFWLAEDCKRYGTLAFAGLARAAFVATQFLQSMRDEAILSPQRYEDFWQSLETIGGNLKRDLALLDKETFLDRYGHLRPGTYEILSESYAEAADQYFEWGRSSAAEEAVKGFHLTGEEDRLTQQMLNDHGLQHTSESLFRFFKAAIEGREYGKFVFSWSINEILKELMVVGHDHGFSRDDLSYLNFQTLLGNYSYSEPLERLMKRSIEAGRQDYELTLQTTLPHLIRSKDDLWCFEQVNSTPNFITLGHTQGNCVMVDQTTHHRDLNGKIALITNADPGYDWILGSGIKGFVTCYGGPNSHMAVRAMELNLPAVIGVGERLFQSWSAARSLDIDCAGKRVTILS
ncbi:MAG: phosphoenolpyruvate synthase [Micavibrio aeruginosavorus]|uniref:Phosphoenolpyruvate synthase n=1 Tax=Micavibrio aeruginosavorus TaxID=349221 RepID=A0A7T5UGJ0_9BACT|nr:MAG: phosphoenolpyruvate synthase [Micavibrio aeruginosavorus]